MLVAVPVAKKQPFVDSSNEPVVEHHMYRDTVCTSGKAADKMLFSVEPKVCQ